jgi:CheY-like chemotaxis protein
MPLCSIDSDDLEIQDQIQHHHYIACKDYDRTIMTKLSSVSYLDLLTESTNKDTPEQVYNSALKNKRILLVEDEDDIVLLFRIILETGAGLKVDSFTDPIAALSNFKSGLYDLIMIDIALPKMNGFELYYEIKKLDNRVKVCFLTASEMYNEKIRNKAFPGLDTIHFIRKPIANEDFIRKIKEILERKNDLAT